MTVVRASTAGEDGGALEMTENPLSARQGSSVSRHPLSQGGGDESRSPLPHSLSSSRADLYASQQSMSTLTLVATSPLLSELSWFFQTFATAASLIIPALALAYSVTLNEVFVHEYALMAFPLCIFCFAVCLAMKPKRRDKTYMAVLYSHYFCLSVLSEVLSSIGDYRRKEPFGVEKNVLQIFLVWLPVGLFCFKVRAYLTRDLMQPDLSKFLLDTILIRGTSEAASILFLSFETLRCILSESSLTTNSVSCEKTRAVNLYLSGFLAFFTTMRLVSQAIPSWLVDTQTLTIQKVAAFDLGREQLVQFFFGLSTLCCATYLLASMGGNAKNQQQFANETEKSVIHGVGLVGAGSMAVVCLWKGFEVARAIQKDKVATKKNKEIKSRRRASALTDGLCTEISSVFVAFSALVSSTNTFFALMYSIKKDTAWISFAAVPLPIAMTWFALSFFMKPLRNDRPYFACFFAQYSVFVIFPVVLVTIGDYRRGNYLASSAGWLISSSSIVGLYIGRRFRSVIAELPAHELSYFLTNTVLESGLYAMIPLLYLAFEVVQCFVQNLDDVSVCQSTAQAQFFLSFYLFFIMGIRLVSNAFPQNDAFLNLPLERILTFDLNLRQKCKVVLVGVTALCAIDLFAASDSNNYDEGAILIVGFVGAFSLGGSCVWEAIVILRGLAKRANEKLPSSVGSSEATTTPSSSTNERLNNSDGDAVARGGREGKSSNIPPLVAEISWFFVLSCFVANLAIPLVSFFYAVTADDNFILFSYCLWPLNGLFFAMHLFMKPRNETRFYRGYMITHFFVFVGGSLVFTLWGDIAKARRGGGEDLTFLNSAIGSVIAAQALLLFYYGLKFRSEVVAKLEPVELSRYLSQTVMRAGLLSLPPMFYVLLEAFKCLGAHSDAPEVCQSVVSCQFFLSCYLLVFFGLKLVTNAMAKEVVDSVVLRVEDFARFNLSSRHKFQAALLTIAVLAAFYLLSLLGRIEEDAKHINYFLVSVGCVGGSSLIVLVISECVALLRCKKILDGEKKTSKNSLEVGTGGGTTGRSNNDERAKFKLQGCDVQ